MTLRLALAFAALWFAVPLVGAQTVAEPDSYRMEAFRAPVPETLLDAQVLDTVAATALWQSGEAVFVDVLPNPPKPDNLPEGTIWRERVRDSIPGAVWLPNTGFGLLDDTRTAYLSDGLARLTGGDKAKTVVFFCLADCWMSWNAARRAILDLGYTSVAWYPEGTDGWTAAGNPVVRVKPEAP